MLVDDFGSFSELPFELSSPSLGNLQEDLELSSAHRAELEAVVANGTARRSMSGGAKIIWTPSLWRRARLERLLDDPNLLETLSSADGAEPM